MRTTERLWPNHRNPAGSMLLELLVAITVGGILAVSLCQTLSLTKESAFGAHSRVLYAAAAQELAERLRATPFNQIPDPWLARNDFYSQLPNPHVQIYSDVSIEQTQLEAFQNPPLMLDKNSLEWTTSKENNAQIPIVAQVTFSKGPTPDCIAAHIEVGPDYSRTSYSLDILLSHYGLQQ